MIPKKIHYCWFGGNAMPDSLKQYILTWKKLCPDYEIIQWDESNFDILSNDYVREAYENKKWAFVSDYVRLYAIFSQGGIYMDTDVEVIKPLDSFLHYKGFTGFETMENPLTGIIGAEKHNPLIKKALENYNHIRFVNKDGSLNLTTNIDYFREICVAEGYLMNGEYQCINGFAIYPCEYFCPFDFLNRKFIITDNAYTIHHFAGSWIPKRKKVIGKAKEIVIKVVGENATKKIATIKRKIEGRN